MSERLHLIAEDEDDLKIVSALMQDAAVRVGDVGYDRHARRLVLLANRYRWEANERSRVRSALTVGSVLKVQRRNWPTSDGTILDLLAVGSSAGVLVLDFAGGTSLRLEVECVDLLLEDVTGPWGATRRPTHAV